MISQEDFDELGKRVAFLEKQLMQRVPQIQTHEFLILTLITWAFEQNPEMNFDRIAEELLRSVDDLPIDAGNEARSERIRALITSELTGFIVIAREKVSIARKALEN